ncbi:MAG: ABC transporter ATP-binding protein [Methylobacter sp.]|nr:ABC transporter ATP-binding protein [Methylobacter sp.]
MNKDISNLSWPLSRLGEGIEELARHGRLNPDTRGRLVPEPLHQQDSADLGRWIEWMSDRLGLEAEPVETPVSQFEQLLRNVGPAVLQIKIDEDIRFLLLVKLKFGKLQLIGPDLRIRRCPVEVLRAAVCAPFEAPVGAEIERLLVLADVSGQRWKQVRSVMLRERLATRRVSGCWMLRLPPTTGFRRQLTQAHLPKRVVLMIGVFTLVYGLEIAGWSLMGQAALNGRLDFGWLIAWALSLLSLIPLRSLGGWLDGVFALELGRILKKRLLAGALRLDLESVKHQGAGQFLGRVMESQALESLALNGGFSVLIAGIELVFAGCILAYGAGGHLHLFLLLSWLALTIGLSWRYFHRLRKWTLMRLDMTHELVERMVGHRTRLAQESATRRNTEEDLAIQEYLNTSKELDASIVPITGAISRGWLIIGLIGLAPAFVSGTGNATGLAISLGGILLANRALTGISGGLAALTRAGIAWTQVSTLFYSANKKPSSEPFLTAAQIAGAGSQSAATKLVDASDLVFRYQPQGEPVLRGVDLSIYQGERILLEGSSGGGKSTLASLLVGLRTPDSGLLLLNGLDNYTLGESWHRLATEAPQFHENHILTGTLAFNLLMGRNWPASEEDFQETHELCVDLGLGDLLERMPSGMMQMVGETGWQLSHGERSRIFLARALLQNTQLTILDESFAALDPESLEKCLNCAFKRAQTLLVIAHP